MIDRAYIGHVSAPRSITVEKGQLKFFAKVIGEEDPVFSDEAAARAAGHPAIPAPPTFVFSLALGAPAETGEVLGDMGVDMRHILHGEQSFNYRHLIYAGDTITLTTRTEDIVQKKGGAMELVVQDTTAQNQHGVVCVEMRMVTVVRHG